MKEQPRYVKEYVEVLVEFDLVAWLCGGSEKIGRAHV